LIDTGNLDVHRRKPNSAWMGRLVSLGAVVICAVFICTPLTPLSLHSSKSAVTNVCPVCQRRDYQEWIQALLCPLLLLTSSVLGTLHASSHVASKSGLPNVERESFPRSLLSDGTSTRIAQAHYKSIFFKFEQRVSKHSPNMQQ